MALPSRAVSTFAVKFLGCKVSQADAMIARRQLLEAGHTEVDEAEAELIEVVDWQVGLKGSWAHDYAYLLATALEVEDRRRLERELLDFYLQRLAGTGGGAISRGAAWMAYRQATLYPYFAWLYAIGRSRLQPSFQPADISLAMIERIGAAIDDLDSLGAVGL